MRHTRKVSWLVAVGALVLLTGCGETVETGDMKTMFRSVEVGDAEAVTARIRMGAGKLLIGGGSDKLMEAKFTYNVPKWEPDVRYTESGKQGQLIVEQPSGLGASLGRGVHYEWDLGFGDDVPMDLHVELGAGESYVDLGSLTLGKVDITTGAGEVEVVLRGSPTVEALDMQIGAGDVTVDLTGVWSDDLDADIKGGVGRLTLRLPDDVGVRVDAGKGIGKISARGMTRRRDAFVNEAYGESDVTLRVKCVAGIGSIILESGGSSSSEGVTI